MGSVQQISVVSDEANPRAARERGRI